MNRRPLIVWGNCQAPPIAELLAEPLSRSGVEVVRLPAVYLIDAPRLAQVYELLPRAIALVAQPVRDDYRLPGCGSDQLSALLPRDAATITFPISYDVSAFPYQVHGHDAHDHRVDAPLTDYHDLRVVAAAARGLDAAETLATWPVPSPEAVRRVHEESHARLRRREAGLDVATSHLLQRPDALWTMTHPTNAVLARIAKDILTALDLPGAVHPPDVEFLGQRRAPVEPAVAAALDWTAPPTRRRWQIDGRTVPDEEVVARQLRFYAERPDVISRTLWRERDRARLLDLR